MMTQLSGEILSFAPGGTSYGCGLLGATGLTSEQAQQERLNEIERRILAIEARLAKGDIPLDEG